MFEKRLRNTLFCEKLSDHVWSMEVSEGGRCHSLSMYSVEAAKQEKVSGFYGGHSIEEIMASGKDILGEEILKRGEPVYGEVKALLPKLETGAFAFLSGALGWCGMVIRADSGEICLPKRELDQEAEVLFAPIDADTGLGCCKPELILVDGMLPVLLSIHRDGTEVLELMYFVEPGDPGRDPLVWIRSKKYKQAEPQTYTLTYRIVSALRHKLAEAVSEELYLNALCNTIGYWLRFLDGGVQFDIPEAELCRVAHGTQISCATTFSGEHPHYGHNIYGEEIHDNFPPNYIWAVEMCCLCGRDRWARHIWEHLLEYVISYDGHFCYRQGEQELLGASAGDYGCLLFLANRYRGKLGADSWDSEMWDKIISMGEVILDSCYVHPQLPDRVMVYMCAEADTNTRINAYLNNNFWAIRGFEGLAELLKAYGREREAVRFEEMAQKLYLSVTAQLKEENISVAGFGKLVPFRFGYTATPATLSTCRDTLMPMNEEAFAKYLQVSYMRDQGSDQDLTENSFANYRYYPEILSAMLLEEEEALAIMKLRENIGGEILGMTRFLERLDDWPVLHYARYLLESGHIDKYIMLLYAHTCHHGRPDLMCYYEQVTAGGEVFLEDCVPSLLTAPIMTAWMFAYETVQSGKLLLLAGLPLEWLQKGCSVQNLGTSFGKIHIWAGADFVELVFENPLEKEAEIVWRQKETLEISDILQGMEYIDHIENNCMILKKGITQACIKFIGKV